MNVFDDVVRDIDGVIVAGAKVYIYSSAGTLASLFESDGTTPKDNPLVSDALGQVKGWLADDGYYTAEYYWGGRKRYVRANVLLGSSPLQQVINEGEAQIAAVQAAGAIQIGLAEDQADAAAASAAAAAGSVGAVIQLADMILQPDAGVVAGAWYGKFFVPTDTDFTLLRHWFYFDHDGVATADLYINVRTPSGAYGNVAGPIPVSTANASTVVSLFIAKGSAVAYQLANVTGSPLGFTAQLEGLPHS